MTGLTFNPTIFDHAITQSDSYDGEIRRLLSTGIEVEALFFELRRFLKQRGIYTARGGRWAAKQVGDALRRR